MEKMLSIYLKDKSIKSIKKSINYYFWLLTKSKPLYQLVRKGDMSERSTI